MINLSEEVYSNEERKYPREDKCKICGEHLGWIMNEMGEGVALGDCGKHKGKRDGKQKKAPERQT
jgi:hypothetical protein